MYQGSHASMGKSFKDFSRTFQGRKILFYNFWHDFVKSIVHATITPTKLSIHELMISKNKHQFVYFGTYNNLIIYFMEI